MACPILGYTQGQAGVEQRARSPDSFSDSGWVRLGEPTPFCYLWIQGTPMPAQLQTRVCVCVFCFLRSSLWVKMEMKALVWKVSMAAA